MLLIPQIIVSTIVLNFANNHTNINTLKMLIILFLINYPSKELSASLR